MKTKVCYDIINRHDTEYISKEFTIEDFLEIIKTSFVSYETFRSEARGLPDFVRQSFSNNYLELYNNQNDQLKQYSKLIFENKGVNRGLAPLFMNRILNFNNKNLPMFDIYINGVSDFLINPLDQGLILNENKNVDIGMIIIRCYNYRTMYKTQLSDFIDINTKLHHKAGVIDSQMRAIPWFLDEWINTRYLKLENTEYTYVMSPLLHHCLKIYDKMLLLSKQKYGYFKPSLLKNAIDASFNDGRILAGMNDKYKTINSIFLRVVPSIKIHDRDGTREFNRFFNPYASEDVNSAYSYSDVVSSGSGKDGKNKITTDHYEEAINNMQLSNMIFTKEENTNNGLFAWNNPAFIPLVNKLGMTHCDLEHLNNHMITNDYLNNEYVTALKGKVDPLKITNAKQARKDSKKYNQRNKLANSRTFLFDLDVSIEDKNLTKVIDNTDYFFHRNVDYLDKNKDIKENDYARNALVAFIDSDIRLPGIKEAVDMSVDELMKWMYSLRGISCEGFLNRTFLSQLMVVPRTERLKCMLNETNPSFKIMIENFADFNGKRFSNKDRSEFIVRQYLDCECTGKIVNKQCRTCGNPRPTTGELLTEYWVDFTKDFEFVTPRGLKITEDGIDINLDYSIRLANSRFKCEELSKLVAVETAQSDIGYVEHLRLGDIDISNVNIPLDGTYFGLGGFKSSINGIPFTVLRAYNALKGEIKYSSTDCLNKTDEINEFLKNFKKSIVRTKMYNPETGLYETKRVEAWVGIVSLSPTEVSQEFNKSRTEDQKNLSKANYALNNLLDFEELNKEYSKLNIQAVKKKDHYYQELVKIAYTYNSVCPMNPVTTLEKEMGNQQEELLKDIRNLTGFFMKNDKFFDTGLFEKLNFKQYITYDKYQHILQHHPLFVKKEFENGFFVYVSLSEDRQMIQKYGSDALGNSLRALYFPKREMLKNMFEMIGDNNVRMSDLLTAFFGVFETLSVSRLVAAKLVSKDGKKVQTYNMLTDNVLKAINSELFNKDGIVNQMTNIAVPSMMSKQLTDINCPYDVTIQGNDYEYKKVVNKLLKQRYPEKTEEEFIEGWKYEFDHQKDEYISIGWCWLENVYCQATRQPLLFSKQNINIKQIWSTHRANIEYKKDPKIGISFSKKHPGTKGIYLNSAFAVLNLEGDTDGDIIFLVIANSIEGQNKLAELYDLTKNMAFFDKDNVNPIAQLIRQTYLVPSMKYVIDEAENLNFTLDTLEIGYSRVKFKDSFDANFDASSNKENVGFLTVSLWYMTYFLDFYLFNYEMFKNKYPIPEITGKNKYEILFIFQYLLAQQNGVRAMKDGGFYGKITFDSLVKDMIFTDDQPSARQLLLELISDYKAENEKENINIDFSDSVTKLFQIFDNMFVSNTRNRGFGYSRDIDGKVFGFQDSKWSNINDDKRNLYDCSFFIDNTYLDFQASFILINGRSYKTFINKFSYEDFLKTLSFKNKLHLKNPLLSYYYDIFTK